MRTPLQATAALVALAALAAQVTACGEAAPRRALADGTSDWGSLPASDGGGADAAAADGVAGWDGGAADLAEDLPPPGTCTKDKHCASSSATPLCTGGACVACAAGGSDAAKFVDEDVPDGTTFKPGASFTKRWGLKNTGSSTWSAPCGYSFAHQSGPDLGGAAAATLDDLERVQPGATRDWKVKLRAPSTAGSYTAYWRMERGGSGFGDKVWVTIKVSKCAADADCLDPTLSSCQPDGSCAAPPCATDADCTDPLKPFCAAAGCVQCKADGDCPSTAPTCQQGSCVAPGSCGAGPKPALGQTAWPVPTKKTLCQSYGNVISYQSCGFHTGIDVCTSDGDPLLSIAAGKVVHVGYMWFNTASTGRGPYAVIIQHSPGFYSTYSHNSKALVKTGDCVTKGQKIAEVGNLGYSSGPHLHFELLDGTTFTGSWQVPFNNACQHYVDPMKYIAP